MKLIQALSILTLVIGVDGFTAATASEITPTGHKLAQILDSMHVEDLWLAGHEVNWRTGEPIGKTYSDGTLHTHCSAFAAAVAEKLGIYLLHPPEHSSILLANAQEEWLSSSGTNQGWHPVKSSVDAQKLANEGELVVVVCKNPDESRPGHIAIVRPSLRSDKKILSDGPEIIQAGIHNYTSTTTKEGFKNHLGAFENGQLLYFAHSVSMSILTRQKSGD
jgi:hypothetical protein